MGPEFLGQNAMVSNFLKVVRHVQVLSVWGLEAARDSGTDLPDGGRSTQELLRLLLWSPN